MIGMRGYHHRYTHTNKEMMALQPGTLVKIKASFNCSEAHKKGGILVFQSEKMVDDGERRFGIKIQGEILFSNQRGIDIY